MRTEGDAMEGDSEVGGLLSLGWRGRLLWGARLT